MVGISLANCKKSVKGGTSRTVRYRQKTTSRRKKKNTTSVEDCKNGPVLKPKMVFLHIHFITKTASFGTFTTKTGCFARKPAQIQFIKVWGEQH